MGDSLTLDSIIGCWRISHLRPTVIKVIAVPSRDQLDGLRVNQLQMGPRNVVDHMPPGVVDYAIDMQCSTSSKIVWRGAPGTYTMEWVRQWEQTYKDVVLIVSCSVQDHGLQLTCSSIAGQPITTLVSQSPDDMTWKEARLGMASGLKSYLSKQLKFVTAQGQLLTNAQDSELLSDIFAHSLPRMQELVGSLDERHISISSVGGSKHEQDGTGSPGGASETQKLARGPRSRSPHAKDRNRRDLPD